FVVFYLLSGVAAAATQVLVSPQSVVPMVGDTGSISGVMGAYILLYPRVRVHTLVTLGFFVTTVALPAYVMLGYWFVLQLLMGAVGSLSRVEGGVAVWAHVGGFVAGMALIKLFANRDYLERRRGEQPFGALRDVHGVISHALQIVGDLHRREQQPEVARHGLLRGEEVHDRLLDLHLEAIEHAVPRDDLRREGPVALEHRVERRTERHLGVGRHVEELRLELRELVVEVAMNPGAAPRGQPTLVGHSVHPNLPVM